MTEAQQKAEKLITDSPKIIESTNYNLLLTNVVIFWQEVLTKLKNK